MGTAVHVSVILLADTHSVLDPRIAAVAQACDFAVHAGDIGSRQVLHALQSRQGIVAVRGNNDTPEKWPRDEPDALLTLPRESGLELPGGYLHVLHGDRAGSPKGLHARLRKRYADARAVIYGHSHRLVCDCTDVPWVLNPGAAGRQRTFGGPSCLVLHASARRWEVEVRRFEPLTACPVPARAGKR